jgi:excisionase family DNA binding protein
MTTLTTDQVAERLGITPSRVRVLIRSGRLPAQRFGRAHVINESDLSLVAERKVGRPRDVEANPASATNGQATPTTKRAVKKGGKK